jgi:hypothetical protein
MLLVTPAAVRCVSRAVRPVPTTPGPAEVLK